MLVSCGPVYKCAVSCNYIAYSQLFNCHLHTGIPPALTKETAKRYQIQVYVYLHVLLFFLCLLLQIILTALFLWK